MTELDRAAVLQQVAEGFCSRARAAERLGVCERQLRRLLRRFEAAGAAGIVSRNRGKSPSNRVDEDVRSLILRRCRGEYAGLGPTLLSQLLAEREGIVVSREWVRALLIESGLWKAQRRERLLEPLPDHAVAAQQIPVELVAEPCAGFPRASGIAHSADLALTFNRRSPDPKKVRTPAQNHPWKRPFQSQPSG